MPLVRLQTNSTVDGPARDRLIREASRLVADMLEKSESYVMVSLETGLDMLFGGSDEPLAFIELKSIGLPGERTRHYSEVLCAFVARELDIPEKRVYIEFADAERHLWGWNGRTFER